MAVWIKLSLDGFEGFENHFLFGGLGENAGIGISWKIYYEYWVIPRKW